MKYNQYLAVILAGSLAACGGGSGSTTGITASTDGTSLIITPITTSSAVASSASSAVIQAKTTLAQGVVTGFGSVIVNGVHYDVEDAAITVDGDSNVESDLGVGQIVRITATMGENGRGKATKLEGESQLRGPIDSIDLTAGVIVALGQSILLTTDTFYQDGVTAETLKVGDVIKVSAYTNADGALVATRIEVKTGTGTDVAQLAGEIADLNTTALTFTINGKTVDYSKATVSGDIVLANDLLVRVRGSVVNDVFVATALQASPLNIKHDDQLGEHDGLAVGGLITDLVANTSFKINDATVILSAETQYEGGTAADLVAGLLVKVQGTLDTNNNLVATKIRLILHPQVNENGLVETVDLAANTFSVNGVTFTVTVDTSFKDSGKDKVRLFSLSDLAAGNTINVQGYKVDATDTTPEHLVATRVERRTPSTNSTNHFNVDVRGEVEAVTASTITIAGHDITVNADTEIAGFDSLEAFLAAAVGTKVEVEGVIENNVLVASSIEPASADEDSRPWQGHSDSNHSANSSAASVPAGGFPSRSESSRSAPANPSSDASHSFSSRSATNPGGAPSRSESSRSAPANPSSDASHSFSSRSAANPGSAPSRSESSKSAPASKSSDASRSFSSRSAMNGSAPSRSESSRSAPTRSSKAASSSSSAAQ